MGDGSLLAGAWLVKTSGKTRLTLPLLAGLLVLCINASSAMAADIFAPPSEGCENLMGQSTNLCVQGESKHSRRLFAGIGRCSLVGAAVEWWWFVVCGCSEGSGGG